MKRIFTFLLITFIGVSILFGQTPHKLEKVTENEVDFWVIDTPEDFIWLCDTTSTLLDADNDGTVDFDSMQVKMSANYRLGADIVFDADETKVDWNNDGTIGGDDALGLYACGGDGAPRFRGHFDGQYYAIKNVYKNCVNSERQRVALFGSVEGCTIENLHLLNFRYYNNEDYGGGIAARANYGGPNIFRRILVEGVYDFSSRGSSSLYGAGIVGRLAQGEVSECVSIMTGIANITDHRRFGALVGELQDSASIKNSYSVSTLTAEEQVGQVIGRTNGEDDNTLIENCYAAGLVSGKEPRDERGSFAGNLGAVSPVSCYWDMTLDEVGVGEGDNAAAVIGLATADFSNEANFSGWDFTNTWKIGDVKGVTRPYLQWQDFEGGPSVSANDIENKQLIKVYPNPVSTNLTIENAPLNVEYRLINLLGQTRESGIVTTNRMILNLEGYVNGIYLLKVGDSVKKIIVQ